jgi:SAM-dependent MidA family methyltransferase
MVQACESGRRQKRNGHAERVAKRLVDVARNLGAILGKIQTARQIRILHTGDPALIALLRDAIRARGPMPFAWFMEQALYHPQHGYYASDRAVIGRRGDYFTSVSVGPLFGRILAAQFSEMWQLLGRPNEFTIVEQGAQTGALARDVLEAAREHTPEFFDTLRYEIVEPHPRARDSQSAALAEFRDKISWRNSLADLEPFTGVHFSNELVDAMSVHLLSAEPAAAATAWSEKHVTDTGGAFEFVNRAPSTPELAAHAATKLPRVPSAYETELNLCALDWIEQLSARLQRGFVITVDYGYPRAQFYDPSRTTGTLMCYSRHERSFSPLENVGHIDITAHVEWTSLVERAEACGLQLTGFVDQHHFLTGWISGELQGEFGETASPKTRRALQTLLHPEFLGTGFQFLGLSKNVPSDATLSGFRFAGDFRRALGLDIDQAAIS